MIDLVVQYDTSVVVMASERFVDGASVQCLNPQDVYEAAKYFVELLAVKARRRNDQIIIDPGLAPVGADTYGLVNIGLDAMRLIRKDDDLREFISPLDVEFCIGTPKHIRHDLEKQPDDRHKPGLDFAIANPEKLPAPLPADHKWSPFLTRIGPGESRRRRKQRDRRIPAGGSGDGNLEQCKSQDPE